MRPQLHLEGVTTAAPRCPRQALNVVRLVRLDLMRRTHALGFKVPVHLATCREAYT